MASRKEERKDETAAIRQDNQEAVSRTLDEAKDSTRKMMDEAKRDVSARTATFNDYQEQTIKATRDMTDNYLESQKEILNSMQSSWVPFVENMYGMYWMSPRRTAEIYARMARTFSEGAIAATRVANNVMFANVEAAKASIQYAQENAKEINRMSVNAFRTFEETSRDVARYPGRRGAARQCMTLTATAWPSQDRLPDKKD